MSNIATTAAVVGIAGGAVIYGTDIFSALVLGPAAADATTASVADLIGRIHEYGDRRLPAPGIVSIIATAVAIPASDTTTGRAAASVALTAMLGWLGIYLTVSAPINKRLRAAAVDHSVPDDTRALQQKWDSVIWPRVGLQAIGLGGLIVSVLAQ